MPEYPKTATERQALRAQHRRRILARAEEETAKYGRSINCGNWSGPTVPHPPGQGCANDGSGCLCECHDQKGAQL